MNPSEKPIYLGNDPDIAEGKKSYVDLYTDNVDKIVFFPIGTLK